MLTTSEAGLLRTPVYHAFDLYANHSGPSVLPTRVSAREGTVPSFTAEDRREPGPPYVGLRAPYTRFSLRGVALLDAQATLSADGRTLYLAVINYDPDRAHAASLDLGGRRPAGPARVFELNGPDTQTPAGFDRPDVATVSERDLPAAPAVHTFPPHSATVLELALTL
jgi:alpha-N-arabinofuranosidase